MADHIIAGYDRAQRKVFLTLTAGYMEIDKLKERNELKKEALRSL